MTRYNKFVAAFALAVLSALVAVGKDGITSVEVVNALPAGIGAVLLLVTDARPWMKAVASGLTAALVVLSAALSDGHITSAEWYQIAFALVAVVTSALVPNSTTLPERRLGHVN
ncbi:MAG TPA: hypothetical protein VLT90_13020 [Terriglobales bacterium]|nr:hypothetical protein [Terriglobales bacterium]